MHAIKLYAVTKSTTTTVSNEQCVYAYGDIHQSASLRKYIMAKKYCTKEL